MAVPVIVFFVFWLFAAYVVSAQGWAVLAASTLNSNTSQPGLAVVNALQQERRATEVYLAGPSPGALQAMRTQRGRTDAAVTQFRDLANSSSVHLFATTGMQARIGQAVEQLNQIGTVRSAIDSGSVSATQAATAFDAEIDPVFALFDATASALNDSGITQDSRTLNSLTRAKEMLSREDALLAGAIAAHRLTAADQVQFAQLSGAWNYQHTESVAALPAADRARDALLVHSPAFTRLAALEYRVIEFRHTARRPPVTAAQWQQTTQPVMAGLQQLVDVSGAALLRQATPVAILRGAEFVLVALLGLAMFFALIAMAIRTVRDLSRRLRQLQAAAHEFAERLPQVVERISHGEQVDVAAEAPPLDVGTDEIGQVGDAFNAAQQIALHAAASEADARRGVRDTLITVAKRMQGGVHRQLRILDQLERRGDLDDNALGLVFRVDQEVTRARRYTENLAVLMGDTPARGWSRPLPLLNVARAAVGEVRDYDRITVAPMDGIMLAGRAIAPLSHLLAELIENALSFSHPRTTVVVRGQHTNHGYAVEIEDHGLGMDEERLADVNRRIREPGEFNLASSGSGSDRAQLGLHVVGRLAAPYGIEVRLTRNAYAGITAVTLIPAELLSEGSAGEPDEIPLDAQPDFALSGAGADDAATVASMAVARHRAAFSDARPERRRPASGTQPGTVSVEALVAQPGLSVQPAPPAARDSGEPGLTASARTANGLPIRTRRAKIASDRRPPSPPAADSATPPRRPADQAGAIVGGLVAGTRQARAEATTAGTAGQGHDRRPAGAQADTQHGSEDT